MYPGTKDKIDELKTGLTAFMEDKSCGDEQTSVQKKLTSKPKPAPCKITREHTPNKQYIRLHRPRTQVFPETSFPQVSLLDGPKAV